MTLSRRDFTRALVMELRPAAVSDITGNIGRNLGVIFDELRAG